MGSLAWYEFRHRLRRSSLRLAAAVFVMVLLVGHLSVWFDGPVPPRDDRFFLFGYIGASMFMLRLGWSEERLRGFDEFLVANFVSPVQYLGAKLLALLGILLTFGIFAFVVALVLSQGEAGYAGWYALRSTIYAVYFIPLIVLVEMYVDTTVPAAAALIAFVGLIFAAEVTFGAERLVRLMGVPTTPHVFTELVTFAAHALVGVPALLLLLLPFCKRRLDPARHWRRAPAGATPEDA